MGETGGMVPTTSAPAAKRPGAAGLWIGGLLIVAGVVLGIVMVVAGAVGMKRTVDDFQRVSSEVGGTITIDRPGRYIVFYERPDLTDGLSFSIAPSLRIEDPNGASVPLDYVAGSETYEIGSRHGRRIGRFAAVETGTYRIVTREFGTDGGSLRGYGEFAIGRRSPLAVALPRILGGVFLGLALGVIGGVLMIVTGVRRSRARRPPATPLGGWAPPPAGGWAAPAGTTWTPTGAPGWGTGTAAGGWAAPSPPVAWPPGAAAPAPPAAWPPGSAAPPAAAGPPGWVPPVAPPATPTWGAPAPPASDPPAVPTWDPPTAPTEAWPPAPAPADPAAEPPAEPPAAQAP